MTDLLSTPVHPAQLTSLPSVPPAMDDVVVIVRVYNEASVVGHVIGELIGAGFRVIAVDDASSDASAQEIDKAGAFRISHPINLGAGAALQTGIEAALRFTDAQYIACFDADGQHRLVDLQGMVGKIREGYDVVLGSRFLDDTTEMSPLRRLILKTAAKVLSRNDGVKLTDAHNGLRLISRDVASAVRLTHSGMAYASQLEDTLTDPKHRIVEFPVQILYTDYSRSKGQPLLNSVNILTEILVHRVSNWSRS
jgi:polyprenyl-phospho-N-acetylgalactosaminyl synthase